MNAAVNTDKTDGDDQEAGELIETAHFSVWDSDIGPGDLVHFRLRHPAFRHAPHWPEALGFVRAVLGGHAMVYEVEVVTESQSVWLLHVRREDILRAWVP